MRTSLTLSFITLILSGCASTTTLKPTDTVRNSAATDLSVTTRFREIKSPSSENPILELGVVRRITREQTFQRRYVKKKVMKRGVRPLVWLGGIAAASMGYIVYQEGLVVLGQDLIGLGVLVPLFTESSANAEVGQQWKVEKKALPPKIRPAVNTSVIASVGRESWALQTDAKGRLALDVSNFTNLAEPGAPLTINLALRDDPTQKTTFTVPAAVLDSHRPALPVIAETVVEPVPIPTQEVIDILTIAILDFQGIGVSAQEAQVLTNRLGTQMVQLGTYHVIERGQMEQILQEQDFQLTGCTTTDCAVEIGQLVGAQQMLAGSFGKLGTAYTIDMRIIDVATGRILKSTSYDIEGSITRLLSEGLPEAVRRIANTD